MQTEKRQNMTLLYIFKSSKLVMAETYLNPFQMTQITLIKKIFVEFPAKTVFIPVLVAVSTYLFMLN